MSQEPSDPKPIVLALVRDLIFASKISAAARAAGVDARIIREPAQLVTLTGSLLLADLNQPGVIAAAAQWKQVTGMPVIGFVSHIDAKTIAEAREAGLDRIIARSGFVEQLPQFLLQIAEKKKGKSAGC
jgi:hypothetical protein